MRIHVFAAAAISAALLAGGCSGSPAEQAAPPAAPAAAPESPASPASGGPNGKPADEPAGKQTEKPTDTALAEDTDAICAQAGRTSSAFGKTFAEDQQLLSKAAAEGKAEKAKAQEKVSRDVQNFSYALLDMSKLAADSGVKKALATMGAQVTALKGDVGKLDDKKLAALHGTLDKACGR